MLEEAWEPEWATKKDLSSTAASPSHVMAAESTSTPVTAIVTLSHEDFESLLKMANGDHALP